MQQIRIQSSAILLAGLFILLGCTGMSCDERMDELKSLYNAIIDDAASMTLEDIEAKCDQTLEQCPDMAIAHELKGLVYWEADRLEEALRHYLKALAISPADEDLLIDARLVAFSARGAYLAVDDVGRIDLSPFKNITLAQYADCPEENRLQWCRQMIDIRDDVTEPPVTINHVDQRGKVVARSQMTYQFDSSAPVDLDALLLKESERKPDQLLHEASGPLAMVGMGMQQVIE